MGRKMKEKKKKERKIKGKKKKGKEKKKKKKKILFSSNTYHTLSPSRARAAVRCAYRMMQCFLDLWRFAWGIKTALSQKVSHWMAPEAAAHT